MNLAISTYSLLRWRVDNKRTIEHTIDAIANLGVSVADLEKSMDAVITDVQRTLIPAEEFQKLQNQVENDFFSANDKVAGIAESLANYEMYYGDASLINTELDRYKKVTREDIWLPPISISIRITG